VISPCIWSASVGALLGWYFLAAFRVATPAQVDRLDAARRGRVGAVAWQLLLTAAGVVAAHLLRHAQTVAGLFGWCWGCWRGSGCKRRWWYTPSKPMVRASIYGLTAAYSASAYGPTGATTAPLC
jgi:hypothetical protein